MFGSSFAPRRVASCPIYTMLELFLCSRRNYRTCRDPLWIRCSKRWGFDVCSFCKNHAFFGFSTWDSISQPQGERDFAIHYTIEMEMWSRTRFFLTVYKYGYLRALTVYVWSEHPFGTSLFLLLLFLFMVFLLFSSSFSSYLLAGVFRKGF